MRGPSITWWYDFVFCLLGIGWFVAEWLLGCASKQSFRNKDRKSKGFREAGSPRGRGIHVSQGFVPSRSHKPGRGMSVVAFWMTFLILWRVGEANNPGPEESCWSLGTFNPSGVTSKADVIGQLEGDFWGMCETHLSEIGHRRFVHALRCQNSKWKYVIPGAPCPLRARSEEVGAFKGVASLSSWPTRALAHALHDGWYQSSRVQVVGTFVHQVWVQVAMVYGYPYSKSHHAPRFQTEQLLEGAIDRIACQSTGPRVIMGDFNWESEELTQLRRLEDLGFKDLQTLAWEWWGVPIKPTGRGNRRIDFVYLSPELWPALKQVVVDDTQWPDHSAVYGIFQGWKPMVERYHWKMPMPVEWPSEFPPVPYPKVPNPTVAYAAFWQQVEYAASHSEEKTSGAKWSSGQFGRGQTLDTVVCRFQPAPIRKSRWGEVEPKFFGNSVRYAQQFKQVRRLQSLVAMGRKGVTGERGQLWHVIRCAPGFSGGFCAWWSGVGHPKYGGPCKLSVQVPSPEECEIIFRSIKQEVDSFAKELSHQRYLRAKDIRAKNMRYVFKDCAREPPKKVDVLIETVAAEVTSVHAETNQCELDQPVPFVMHKPVVTQGRNAMIQEVKGSVLSLDDVGQMQPGDVLRQTAVIAEIPAVFEAFRQEWEPRWNRHRHVAAGQWDQICQFAQQKLPPVRWSFPKWTEDRFAQVVRSKKSTAATGPDGISRKDLMSMPSHVIKSLINVYEQVETASQWPLQLTNGIVSSLEKTPDAQSVKQYRPVVVYPLVYRVWSSARARQFLKAFARVTPPGLRGGLPARQSKSIWFEVALALEADHVSQPSLLGVVADLQKAFNTIPRVPLWQCLLAMQCPTWLIHAWGSFVNQQTRRFKVRNSVGPGIPSDCGFPEGCGLSVCAMAVLDLLFDAWMTCQFPKLQVLTFVDDWQLIHRDITTHQAIEERLLAFVDLLDMKLDRQKTFTWSTNADTRAQLRKGQFRVVHHAKSLGVHANFTKQRGNKTMVDRIRAMGPTWKLLRRSLSPYTAKIASLRVLAWPRALHGVGVTSLAESHFANLRTGAALGLRSNRVGASPVLRLAQHGFTYDPEGWAILSTIQDFRDFAVKEYVETTLSKVSSGDVQLPTNGPIAVLVDRISRLGWQISSNGGFVDDIGEFSVFDNHIDAIRTRIALAWPRVMAVEVAHRKTFNGIHRADISETNRVLKAFNDSDRVYLQCALDGTLYTNHGKQHRKQATADSHLCPFCQQPDGFRHRLWHCSGFDDLRDTVMGGLRQDCETMPDCHSCHAWAIKPNSHLELMQYFEAIQPFDVCRYRLDLCEEEQLDLFVDGSCYSSTEIALRFASWAVTTAHWKGSPLDHSVVAAGWVPGIHQSAFRGELEAMTHALTIASMVGRPCRIWSDCQGVANGVRRLQQGLWRISPNMSHFDRWEQIQMCLETTNVVIMQVYSHIAPSVGDSYLEFWGFWHNSLVDIAASRVNEARGPSFWALWKRCEVDLQQGRRRNLAIAKFIVESGKRADRSITKPAKAAPLNKDGMNGVDLVQPLVQQSRVWQIPATTSVKFGYEVVSWLHQWWCSTGQRFLAESTKVQWVSFLQLYIDFQLSTGQSGPQLWKAKWYFGDRVKLPDFHPGYVKRCKWFQMLLKHYWVGNRFDFRSRAIRPASGAICCWLVTAQVSWPQDRLDRIDQIILEMNHGVLHKGVNVDDFSHVEMDEVWAVGEPNTGFTGFA